MTFDDMAAVHAACFTTPRPWSAAEIASTLDSAFAFVLTEPSGFLIGRVVAGEAELITLAVDPSARKRGTGGRLVDGFLAEAKLRGAESVFLEVAANNLPAQSLYARKGFEPKGKRRGYYQSPTGERIDALVLARAI
ncbi:MAG: GNAT family N-acetyltransferase [Cypionkella sp.]|uniref:GNAT family N-acetyltransferase n=1 Tax=Cypionkella sp. TaxID=2811411 RepID=UPI002ABAF6B2|nr:GNAT family N-acetyltransferase [Cypionkella sp.]MDZ4310958.1 GNAT family N-acetyltransferase [Cypionkella sp.]MDZ4395918.1 GNAT family N-acetyltransferase [Cypionkella sp.]